MKAWRKTGRHPDTTAGGAAPVSINEALAVDPFNVTWTFSDPIVFTGGNIPELEIDASGNGFTGPDSVVQTDPLTIEANYNSSSGVQEADLWRVLTQPANITTPLFLPADGLVNA